MNCSSFFLHSLNSYLYAFCGCTVGLSAITLMDDDADDCFCMDMLSRWPAKGTERNESLINSDACCHRIFYLSIYARVERRHGNFLSSVLSVGLHYTEMFACC